MRRSGIALIAALLVAGCSSQLSAPISGALAPATAHAKLEPAVASVSAARAASVSAGTKVQGAAQASIAAAPTIEQLIGQKLVVRMDGITPSADLLARIRRGEIGGVILLGFNITTPSALIALTAKLRAAAAAGGQPKLLIAVDQEGGPIKRIPWAPPTLSPTQMGRIGLAATARAQGTSTGAALHGLGINVDLAPVADVPASTASFIYRGGRTFSFSSARTAVLADAFASGLESKGVLPAMKHFPGLGFATHNTDGFVVTIGASRGALAPGLRPYRTAIGHQIPLIMLSNATYSAYDAGHPAGWSHTISVALLRRDLGFTGVTISDSLDGTAHARGLPPGLLAFRAAYAGTDMILMTGSEASTRAAHATLLAHAKSGSLSPATLRTSYDRILALKARL